MPSWLMIYARLSLVVLVRSRRLAKLRRRYSPSSAARQLIRRRRLSRPYSSEPSSPKQPQHSHRDSNFGTDNKGPTAFVIGSVAGMAGSLVGMGGAFISLPLMTGVLRMTQHQAHATSLAAVAACGTGGALGFISSGNVDWAAAAAIATSGMISARIGARFAGSLDAGRALALPTQQDKLIVLLRCKNFAIIPFLIGAALGWEEKPSQQEEDREKNGRRNRQGKDARVGASSDNKNGFPPAMHLMAMADVTTSVAYVCERVGGGSITVPAVALVSDFSHYKVNHDAAHGGDSEGPRDLTCSYDSARDVGRGHTPPHDEILASDVLSSMCGDFGNGGARFGRQVAEGREGLGGCYLGGRHVALRVDEDVLRIIFFGLMVGIGGRTFAAARHAVIFK
eukprot:jgi/Bigna1/70606/fgenesh1_pg.12_\